MAIYTCPTCESGHTDQSNVYGNMCVHCRSPKFQEMKEKLDIAIAAMNVCMNSKLLYDCSSFATMVRTNTSVDFMQTHLKEALAKIL